MHRRVEASTAYAPHLRRGSRRALSKARAVGWPLAALLRSGDELCLCCWTDARATSPACRRRSTSRASCMNSSGSRAQPVEHVEMIAQPASAPPLLLPAFGVRRHGGANAGLVYRARERLAVAIGSFRSGAYSRSHDEVNAVARPAVSPVGENFSSGAVQAGQQERLRHIRPFLPVIHPANSEDRAIVAPTQPTPPQPEKAPRPPTNQPPRVPPSMPPDRQPGMPPPGSPDKPRPRRRCSEPHGSKAWSAPRAAQTPPKRREFDRASAAPPERRRRT